MRALDCFLFGGVSAGLKQSRKLDLGLIFCSQPCVVGGIFTQNRYPSPHVLYGREILPSKNIQAILVSSGQIELRVWENKEFARIKTWYC